MIRSAPNHQSAYSSIITAISIVSFGLVGGFFVHRFGIMPGLERVSILMMLGIAAISYSAVIRDTSRHGIIFLITSGTIALMFEYIGVQYCVPYGCFSYGNALGAKILDTVPWTVFVGWTPLIIGVYAILRQYIHKKPMLIIAGACLLTLIDTVLDPGAVFLGFWSFADGGWYYNVPRSNFAGWMISGSVGMLLAHSILHKQKTTIQWTYSAGLTLSFFNFISIFAHMWLASLLGTILLTIYIYFCLYTAKKIDIDLF